MSRSETAVTYKGWKLVPERTIFGGRVAVYDPDGHRCASVTDMKRAKAFVRELATTPSDYRGRVG